MKLFVKNKLFSLTGSSVVKNENGEVVYKVKGKPIIFSLTRKKKIYNKNGKLIYIVRNKVWSFWKRRAIIYNGEKEKIAQISNTMSFKNKRFVVENYPEEITFEGKFFSRCMQILKNGEVFGKVLRELNFVRDSFVVETSEEDADFVVALIIAIDNICDNRG